MSSYAEAQANAREEIVKVWVWVVVREERAKIPPVTQALTQAPLAATAPDPPNGGEDTSSMEWACPAFPAARGPRGMLRPAAVVAGVVPAGGSVGTRAGDSRGSVCRARWTRAHGGKHRARYWRARTAKRARHDVSKSWPSVGHDFRGSKKPYGACVITSQPT